MYPIGSHFTDIHRFYENSITCCVSLVGGMLLGVLFGPFLEPLRRNLIHSLNDFKPERQAEIDTPFIRIEKLLKENDQDRDILSFRALSQFTDQLETLLIQQEDQIEEATVQDKNTFLLLAINEFEDHIKTLLIQQEDQIEDAASQGGNALLLAIKHIKNQTKTLVIQQGDHIEKATDQDGNTGLFLAINDFKVAIKKFREQIETLFIDEENDTEIFSQHLRNWNLCTNCVSTYSTISQHQATAFIMKYQATIVKLFIETGANLEAIDQDGNTPLLLALRQNNYEMAKLLIKHGANIQVKNKMGESPVSLAMKSNHGEIIRICINILAICDPDATAKLQQRYHPEADLFYKNNQLLCKIIAIKDRNELENFYKANIKEIGNLEQNIKSDVSCIFEHYLKQRFIQQLRQVKNISTIEKKET